MLWSCSIATKNENESCTVQSISESSNSLSLLRLKKAQDLCNVLASPHHPGTVEEQSVLSYSVLFL